MPGVRGQGSGVRCQVSGVRGQGSGVRYQVSGARCQGVRGQGSGIRCQVSEVRGQVSGVTGRRGTANNKQQTTKGEGWGQLLGSGVSGPQQTANNKQQELSAVVGRRSAVGTANNKGWGFAGRGGSARCAWAVRACGLRRYVRGQAARGALQGTLSSNSSFAWVRPQAEQVRPRVWVTHWCGFRGDAGTGPFTLPLEPRCRLSARDSSEQKQMRGDPSTSVNSFP